MSHINFIECLFFVADLSFPVAVISDGLFCSMYFRYFRHMAIHPEYCEVYGETIQRIMVDSPNRAVAVLAIAEKAVEIGRIDPLRRSATEQRFLQGLFTVNSALKNRICADWEDLQYISFVQNAKVSRFRAFTKVSRTI